MALLYSLDLEILHSVLKTLRDDEKQFENYSGIANADNFARGGGRRNSVKNSAWSMRHSRPDSYKNRDSKNLFSRSRTKGKTYRHNILAKQNADRARKRIRGNKVFQHKKFF
jgi:hypothetical protein